MLWPAHSVLQLPSKPKSKLEPEEDIFFATYTFYCCSHLSRLFKLFWWCAGRCEKTSFFFCYGASSASVSLETYFKEFLLFFSRSFLCETMMKMKSKKKLANLYEHFLVELNVSLFFSSAANYCFYGAMVCECFLLKLFW